MTLGLPKVPDLADISGDSESGNLTRRYATSDLDALFRPRSIAVVGASDDPHRIGGMPLQYLKATGYAGDVFGVNPRYDRTQDRPCVPAIVDLPPGVDTFILAIPAAGVPDALTQIGERGGRSAIVFSGGYAETGEEGQALQQALADTAARYRLPVLGPNCLGMVSFHDGAAATFSSSISNIIGDEPGPVAIVSQSGGFAANLAVEAAANGARFSYMLATGNEAVVDLGDALTYLATDDRTSAVVGYLEGVRDGDSLSHGLHRLRQAGKPVCLLKVGGSTRGAAAVAGHTALMSGTDDAIDACFRRYGVERARTFDDLVDFSARSTVQASERRDRTLAVATISGGTAVYILDACEDLGVELADLEPDTAAALTELLPDFARVGNPVDLTAQVINDASLLVGSLEVLFADPGIDDVLLFLGGQEARADQIVRTLSELPAAAEGRLTLAWLGVKEGRREQARRAGIRTYADPVRFLRTRARLTRQPSAAPTPTPEVAGGPADSGSQARYDQLAESNFVDTAGGPPQLDEWEGMQLLRRWGIPTPAVWRWDLDQDPTPPADLRYPLVVKILRPHLAHRSKRGGVLLGIDSPAALQRAATDLRERLDATQLLLAHQVPAGTEMILGVLRDPMFGVRAVAGEGGIWANEIADYTTLIAPLDHDYVIHELGRLRLGRQLEHTHPGATAGLAQILRKLSNALVAEPNLAELECNPVVIGPEGLIAVDCLGTGTPT